jgi:hypothetical protein
LYVPPHHDSPPLMQLLPDPSVAEVSAGHQPAVHKWLR